MSGEAQTWDPSKTVLCLFRIFGGCTLKFPSGDGNGLSTEDKFPWGHNVADNLVLPVPRRALLALEIHLDRPAPKAQEKRGLQGQLSGLRDWVTISHHLGRCRGD